MNVIDANVIVYLVCPIVASLASDARSAWVRGAVWHAPALWRTEVASALIGLMRRRQVSKGDIVKAWAEVNKLGIVEHPLAGPEILPFAIRYNLSAYDAQYVRLAMNLKCHLITADNGMLTNAAPYAFSLERFAAGDALPVLPR